MAYGVHQNPAGLLQHKAASDAEAGGELSVREELIHSGGEGGDSQVTWRGT